MDANAALAIIRYRIARAKQATNEGEAYEALADAIESFEALDEWLKTGGFLPSDWRNAGRRIANG